MDRILERRYQLELEALERFRLAYTGTHKHVPLSGDDPDVRRLLEALAFFTARTRVAAARSVDESLLRILRQHFPYLLSPIPAMGMMQVRPSAQLVEPAIVPAGTSLDLTTKSPLGVGEDRAYRFRTTAALRVLPIELEKVEKVASSGERGRIAFSFAGGFKHVAPVDAIDLHIDYLNDLRSSFLLYAVLGKHVTRAFVIWETIDASATVAQLPAQPCTAELGRADDDVAATSVFSHPLERLRAQLHFPQQDLYLRLRDLRAPANWRAFKVHLEIDDEFPAALQLHRDYFRLHSVPIINLEEAAADPIEHDGTRERHLAHHPSSRAGFVPVSVRAAYRTTKSGLSPLEPMVVGAKAPSFEAIVEKHGTDRRAWISLSLPGAFEKPETVVVDATWHQPDIARVRARDIGAKLVKRSIEADWKLVGPLSPPLEAVVDEDREVLLRLLALKGQNVLEVDDLRFVFRAMGVHEGAPFSSALTAITSGSVVARPSGRRSRALKYVYRLEMDQVSASELPKVEVFCARVCDLLAIWSTDEIVELAVRIVNLKRELHYPDDVAVSS